MFIGWKCKSLWKVEKVLHREMFASQSHRSRLLHGQMHLEPNLETAQVP